jgi:glycosyltransferase involved in cell wall biosynthesis
VISAGVAIGRKPSVIVCQSPYEGVGAIIVSRILPVAVRPAVVVEVHGDWRTASRLYGSPTRRLLSPAADAVAAWAVRRADVVRVIGSFTGELVREAGFTGPVDVYTAFGGLDAFLATPPVPSPDEPSALFVGVLEPYKSVDVLLEAWRTVATTIPGARLWIIGEGSQGASLRRQAEVAGLTSCIHFLGRRSRGEIIQALDRARLLALPSRSEGMGRVILEAFARGRPVVASAVGGIPELVREPDLGRLVPPEDPDALAKALMEVLGADTDVRAAFTHQARAEVEDRDMQSEFEAGIERLSGWAR